MVSRTIKQSILCSDMVYITMQVGIYYYLISLYHFLCYNITINLHVTHTSRAWKHGPANIEQYVYVSSLNTTNMHGLVVLFSFIIEIYVYTH